MRPKSFFLSACLCVFLPACLPANVPAAIADTQASPQGSAKLTGVTFSGSAKLSNDQLLATSGLKVGDTVTKGDLQGAADRMSALGVFSSVNYTFKTGAAGVEVQFVVKEAPLFPVEYDNFRGSPTRSSLRRFGRPLVFMTAPRPRKARWSI